MTNPERIEQRAKPEVGRWGHEVEYGIVGGHRCKRYVHRPRSLAELLLDAQRWRGREFVVQGSRRLTVDDHGVAVARVAAWLQELGARPGDSMLLLGYNSVEWLVAFWAVQSIGATAVLGNAWWSDAEAQEAVDLVQPSMVLTDRPAQRHPSTTGLVLRFADLQHAAQARAESQLVPAAINEEAPAIVIFSSGTTGKAKGVVMSHRSVIANIQNLLLLTGRMPSDLPQTHAGTVSLLSMPLFHLAGLQVSFMTMLSGGKLVFLDGRFDPAEVLGLIERERVRAWGCVPTMVSRVVQHESFAEFDTSSVSSVQMGGAAIPAELRLQVQRMFPNTRKRVGSMYGLTEAGGVLAAGSGADIEGRPGCVGKALPSVELRIDRPNAEGVGEIAARAPTATSGYLKDDTPILDADGWVLSGDLGRIDGEGFLYIVGRSKDTIIRGGENVASVHVEDCLRSHPDVMEVAVVPLPHADLGEEVAAAVVLRPQALTTEAQLQEYAASRIARFQVPSRWWLTKNPLPTNASGKVIKREVIARWPATRVDEPQQV